jgi:hypothetical protein
MARQARWFRGLLVLLAAFCLSMAGAFTGVGYYLGKDHAPAPPDSRLLLQGERLREMQAELVDAARRLAARLPEGQTSATLADTRWVTTEYLPRLNYLRLRLEDRHGWAGLPIVPHEAVTRAVDALRAAAREPASTERRARAFDQVREAAQAVETWVRDAGVASFVRTPATLPRL